MKWNELRISTTSEGVELVSEILYELGVKGVVVEDRAEVEKYLESKLDFDYADTSIVNNMSEDVLVIAYVSESTDLNYCLGHIRSSLERLNSENNGINFGTCKITYEIIDEQEWAESWKKYFKPTKVSNRLVVKPTWESYEAALDEVVIEIDPGMAFGTGTHETTILCLRAIENHVSKTTKLLDVGCGTGILSIAALLLGADSVTAVDIDSDAVRITNENAALNNVSDRISAICGNLIDNVNSKFDIIVANISSDSIINLLPQCKDALGKNGLLIFSGIIRDRLDEVKEELENFGIKIIETVSISEWFLILCEYA